MRINQRPHWRKALEIANKLRFEYRHEQSLGHVYGAALDDPKYAALWLDRNGWYPPGLPVNERQIVVDLSPQAKEHLAELAKHLQKVALEQAAAEPPEPPPPNNVIEIKRTGT